MQELRRLHSLALRSGLTSRLLVGADCFLSEALDPSVLNISSPCVLYASYSVIYLGIRISCKINPAACKLLPVQVKQF